MKKKKICFICSSGGHFSELNKLRITATKFDSFLVIEKTQNFESDFCKRIYFTKEINRNEKLFLFRFLFLCIKEFLIFIKERPTHIITTGALCSYPMAKMAKIFKKKIIYIESYARVYDLSETGKRIYKFADLFLVQWPDLIKKYPKAIFVGSFFRGDNL